MHPPTRRARTLLATLALLLLPTVPTYADTLSVTLSSPPFISATSGTLSYDASTNHFNASATPTTYTDPSLPNSPIPFQGAPQLTIDLQVDSSGNFVSTLLNGFTLTGSLDLDNDGTPDATGTLLAGPVTSFGSADPGPPSLNFDLKFLAQSGALTQSIPLSGGGTYSAPFPTNSLAGAILTANDVTEGTLANFNANFSSSSVDITAGPFPTPVPLPTAAAASLALLLPLATRRRRAGSPV